MPERVIVRNTQSPGDYIVLTAAIRDLHKAHPGRFEIMMDVPQPAVYLGSPYVRGFAKGGAGVKSVVAQYPAIHQSNQRRGIHFLWGFIEDLNRKLSARATLTDFRPDMHLNADEMRTPPCGLQRPYWIFASGGKKDFTAKWWDPTSWQQVVNQMMARGHRMVQVGGGSHIHPPIPGAVDLVGKTSFRELMQLIYHAEGVLCVVTCLMHIAAAFNKPCVVVAGGREPWWWEAYNQDNRLTSMRKGQPMWVPPSPDPFIPHQYLHTVGQLDCCKTGGCWLSRIEGTASVCKKPVSHNGRTIPRCLQMITPEMVLAAVESYYASGIIGGTRRELVLPPVVVAQPSDPMAEVEVVRGADTEQLKESLKSTKARWLVWVSPAFDPLEPSEWIEQVTARIEREQSVAGGLLCWRYGDHGERIWYLDGALSVMNVARAREIDWTKWVEQVRTSDIGDLVRYV